MKKMEKINIDNDTQTYWLGMSDYEINLPIIDKTDIQLNRRNNRITRTQKERK